jgi:hypothetical protein
VEGSLLQSGLDLAAGTSAYSRSGPPSTCSGADLWLMFWGFCMGTSCMMCPCGTWPAGGDLVQDGSHGWWDSMRALEQPPRYQHAEFKQLGGLQWVP